MRKEDLLEAMSYIDEDYIMEARESGRQKRRHVFGTVAAALALSIILPNVSPGTAMAMANIPLIGKYFQVVTVRDFQYDENNKLADVKIPQVDTAQAQGINREIEAYTNQLLEEFKEDVEAGEDNFRELSVSYEVTMDTDIWFTLRISAFEAQGGGANQVKYYHIDKTTGKEMKLADLFAANPNYISAISDEIKLQMREQMAKGGGKVYFIAGEGGTEDGFDTISPDEDFYLTPEGNLVIVFDEYQVAPGSMGCPEFTIPKQMTDALRSL